MELKARYSQRTVKQEFVEILCTPKDCNKIIDVLQTLKKKTKLDRYEESILDDLLVAFMEPEEKAPTQTIADAPIAVATEGVAPRSIVSEEVDKVGIAKLLKSRLDPRNEKPMETFINESVIFGKTQFGIKTDPIDGSIEAFYDWLLTNNIINPDGSPTKRQ